MFDALHSVAKGTLPSTHASRGNPEDKQALNYHILLIENMHHFLTEVRPRQNVVLEKWEARINRDRLVHISLYTTALISRPLGQWVDFLESTEALVKAASGPKTGIASKPSHSKGVARKILASHDAKEIRKGVEALVKRVEKHFTRVVDSAVPRDLVALVLEEVRREYEEKYDRMKVIIDQVYEGGLDIEWRKEDVAAMLQK
jgi:hypothetical protein